MSKYITGLVSVVIPTYRRSEKLIRAIDSVLAQTYLNLELLVVNDNEPGDEYTDELVKKTETYYLEPRFRLLFQKKHINGAAARNFGVNHAKGEYIAFLDDDDWWCPEKIKKQVAYITERNLKDQGVYGVVSTLVEFYGANGVERKSAPYREGYIFSQILSREIDVTTCSVLIFHEAFDDIGGFDEALSRHQEIQMLSELTSRYQLCLLSEFLTCVDISAGDNNPSYEKLCIIKQDLFRSVGPLIELLPRKMQKQIKGSHEFELAYVAMKERKLSFFIVHVSRILISYTALKISLKRMLLRIRKMQ